ncbi:MAG TPA: heme exporter protein CcmB [Ferrovibrio sp.]|uniref:heme exporter protein CcmB n=1 Tax=Ferrovibrio sp. TaxID=1917215 RepID=UPI002B4B0E34|nr:heme exporter protein CcmB [Ferrovibrio sp.]HLT78484.1 heme exporter protein CcmB [Ferrovibrio sp.]
MTAFLAIVARDLRLGAGAQGAMLTTLLFFVLAVSLFPLGVGPEPQILARIASGAIWVAALLAAMLSLDRLFQADQEDGTLDLLAQAPLPLGLVALAKTLAHWLTTGLPLALIAPLLALLMQMETEAIPVLLLSLLLGTPSLSLIGAIGAALTLGARRGAVLVPLITLPLVIPVLIFGVGAVDAAAYGLSAQPHLLLLGAFLAAALALSPFALAGAIKLALE